MNTAYIILIVFSLLWCGFMSAISFMESWLKFRAPGLETTVGLSVGRKVFGGLNKVEWSMVLIIWITLIIFRPEISRVIISIYGLLTLFIISQSYFLLPMMNKRVDARLKGEKLPPNNYHFWYVGMEMIKFAGLLYCAVSLFKVHS